MPRRTLWLALLWLFLVLYPNPAHLVVSAHRAWRPVIDAAAVRELAKTLPDEPHAIEDRVNTSLVPYAVPWQTYGVPWYFPTPAEVLASKQGDCQARAVLFASILEAKGIEWRLVGSFDHLWVDYPGKHASVQESAAVAVVTQQPDGGYKLHWPELFDWRASWEIERAYFWDPMPRGRLALLLAGWAALLVLRAGVVQRAVKGLGIWARLPRAA